MREQQLWLLIAGKLTGHASANELLELNKYLQADKALSWQVNVLARLWDQPKCLQEQVPAKAFEKLMRRIEQM